MKHFTYSIKILVVLTGLMLLHACNKPASVASAQADTEKTPSAKSSVVEPTTLTEPKEFVVNESIILQSVAKPDAEWKYELSDIEYYVIREKGTERAFTGTYWDNKADGIYICNACELPLYASDTKFKSGTGWPSYYQAIVDDFILEDTDYNLGYARTEIMCARCEGHLGHVFNDGPEPTGKRHCVNSASLKFVPESDAAQYYEQLKSQASKGF